ncbi:OmpW family outer membrane protein [uncultured Microbulbifer sp.]|uniref:OmpW/AlkL family protein n=1 Tax=uncultured Microbulbifer sp. TaxID=348147 RepID=UPI0025D65238|nr:OmpW family outer membrane protein [uncultured Microbulbifer sp.]
MKKLKLAAAVALLFPALCVAQIPVSELDLTRFYLRVGASFVYPDDDNTPLKYQVLQDWDLYRTGWEVEDDTTWNASVVWRPLSYLGLEMLYIGGADHSLDLTNFHGYPGRDNIAFGNFSASSANLFINWYWMDETCLGQPYIGIGVNYTHFYDDELNAEFQNYLIDSGIAAGQGKLGAGHSWGGSAQLGLDWRLGHGRTWLINAAAIYTDASTDAVVTFPVNPGYDRLYSDIEFNPWTFNLGVTYEF